MKKMLLSLLVLVSFLDAKNTEDTIKDYIQAWQPLGLNLNDGILVIPFNQSRITNKIYLSILRNGVCLSASLEKWNGVKQIVITNKYAKQGFVFDGGYVECKKAVNLIGNKVDLYLLGRSRTL